MFFPPLLRQLTAFHLDHLSRVYEFLHGEGSRHGVCEAIYMS